MTNFREEIIEIKGRAYAVRRHGAGKVLFALHGFSETSATWDALDLAGYEIFAIDLLGHGKSEKPVDLAAYQLENILTDLALLFSKLTKNKPFSLLGYSMGGRLALRFCLAFPDAPVEHLLVESAGAGLKTEEERASRRLADEKLARNILANGSGWFADFWGQLSLFKSQKALPQAVQERIWQRRANNVPLALAQTLRGTGQGELADISNKIKTLKPNLLYLYGELDHKYSQIVKEIFAPNPSVTVIGLPACGHNAHLENPQLYQQILQNYLAESVCDIIKKDD